MATFRFGNKIGGGSFGEVREAVRTDDGWKCAVKTLLKGCTGDELKRFKREVRMQMQMEHRHVVPIVGKNEKARPPWFIMPRALMNLCDYLKRKAGETEIWLFEHIAKGVQHAHDNGVIHRDLKPANVLLFKDEDGHLYAAVADFGLGRMIDRDTMTLTVSGMQVGTPAYFAPEQYDDGKNADERSDVYTLGKILYEILSDLIPYPSMNFKQVPSKYVYIIRKATSDDPDNRYQNVAAMLEDYRLATKKHRSFAPVSQSIRAMIEKLSPLTKPTAADMNRLANTLASNLDDPQMLLRVVPHIPDHILRLLLRKHLVAFLPILEAYDEQIDSGVTFEYCDIVADFYARIFSTANDNRPKAIVLKRLPSLGTYNKRWHVGRTLARLVGGLREPELILVLRDAVCENSTIAAWCDNYFNDIDLPKLIRRAIDETK